MTSAIDKWRTGAAQGLGRVCLLHRGDEGGAGQLRRHDPLGGPGGFWRPSSGNRPSRWIVERIDILAPIRMGRADNSDENWEALAADPGRSGSPQSGATRWAASSPTRKGSLWRSSASSGPGWFLQDVAYLIQPGSR